MSIRDIHEELFNELPGCPEPLITRNIVRACRAFFKDTERWDTTLDLTLQPDTNDYDLAAQLSDQNNIEIVRVFMVYRDSDENDEIGSDYYTFDADTITFEDAVLPGTGDTQAVTCKVVIVPKYDANTRFDDSYSCGTLIERFSEPIAAKAKSILMLQPKKSWSDAQMGIYWREEYKKGVADSRSDTITRGIDGGLVADTCLIL